MTRLGKLRIVNRAAFVAWLERGAFGGARKDEEEELLDDEREVGAKEESAEAADELLDSLGLRGAAEGAKKRKAKGKG